MMFLVYTVRMAKRITHITRKMTKILLIIAGSASLALGVVGIILPLLPTTPFLLLAAYCYMKSSDKLYKRLTEHRALGPHITNYLKYRAVPKRLKYVSIALLWLALAASIIFIPNIYIRILLGVVGIGVSAHILTLKTVGKEAQD